jgi:hypothetical protein
VYVRGKIWHNQRVFGITSASTSDDCSPMISRYTFVASLLFVFASGMGCRDQTPVDGGAAKKAAKKDPLAEPAKPEKPQPPPLSEKEAQAVKSIVAAGGSFQRNDAGLVHAIDLASERVFADDAVLRAVYEFPHLTRLRLAVSKAAPETLAQLATLTELEELFLQDVALDDAALQALLSALPNLRRLGLRRLSRVTDAGLEALARVPKLEVVALIEMSGVTGVTVRTLQGVPRLRFLDIRNCGQLTTPDFGLLTGLSQLEELKLGGPAVSDEVLAIVLTHPSVTALGVEDAQITAAGLQRLAATTAIAQRLKSLSLVRCLGITDDSLTVLRQFPQLESLALREIMLNGSFLQTVYDSGNDLLPIQDLTITDAFLTDESLTPLPGMFRELRRLDLSGNRGVTNASLAILRQIRSLEEARLDRTAVTEEWHPRGEQ